ncbi:unnamed protein product [marine sediment metagenome]|uniref:Uncharacterized protein n=1 Tax=marine sediment metagenome TaxID=412755 RepID=X0SQR7_9ZZZZ
MLAALFSASPQKTLPQVDLAAISQKVTAGVTQLEAVTLTVKSRALGKGGVTGMIQSTKKSSDRSSEPQSSRIRMLVRMELSNPPFKENVRVTLNPLNGNLFEVTSWQSM